jgi:hypothetical protein
MKVSRVKLSWIFAEKVKLGGSRLFEGLLFHGCFFNVFFGRIFH